MSNVPRVPEERVGLGGTCGSAICLRVRPVAKGDGLNVSTCRSSGASGGSSADGQKISITRDRRSRRPTLSLLAHAICAARNIRGVDYILEPCERFICMAIRNGLFNGTVQSADCTVYEIISRFLDG